jgi:hypothetical protein
MSRTRWAVVVARPDDDAYVCAGSIALHESPLLTDLFEGL